MLIPGPRRTEISSFQASLATDVPSRSAAVESQEQARALAVG